MGEKKFFITVTKKKGRALSHVIGYEESGRKVRWLLRSARRPLYIYCHRQQL